MLIQLVWAGTARTSIPVGGSSTQQRRLCVDFSRLRDPILSLASSFITHSLPKPRKSRLGVLVRHDLVSRVKHTVTISVTSKSIFGIFNEVTNSKRIAQCVAHGHSSGRNAVISKVVPRESVPMRSSKHGHFYADESVLNGGGKIIGRIMGDIVGDGAKEDQDGEEEALPVRREDDELDAEEFRYRSERAKVVMHAHPEQTQGVQADSDANVVDDATPKIPRAGSDVALLICAGGFHDDSRESEYGL